jgi:hypothetical protein
MLAYEVELRGSLNILDLHIHCENFYAKLLNCIYGFSLENINAIKKNADGIDLVDHASKMVLQVSATATPAKIQSSLSKDLTPYAGYNFKFASISKDSSALRTKAYENPHGFIFQPTQDIIDVKSLAAVIQHLPLSKQEEVYKFLQRELPTEVEVAPSETNIAALIQVLGAQNLSVGGQDGTVEPFRFDDKIAFNGLSFAAELVEQHAIYQHRIEKLYASFDEAGQNKSISVLSAFNGAYLRLSRYHQADELFFKIVDEMVAVVKKSSNHVPISSEELELYVSILAVDAFLRCRIFKKPKPTLRDHVAA